MMQSDDMLARIMRMQAEFQTRTPNGVTKSFKEMSGDETAELVRTQTLACITELTEALGEVGWKPWASSRHINVEGFRAELIDAFRFWMNLICIAGLSPEGVMHYYEESLAKTNKRVDNGYTGLAKCPGCKRSYDDRAVSCWPRTENEPGVPPTPAFCAISQLYLSATGDVMEWSVAHTDWVVSDNA